MTTKYIPVSRQGHPALRVASGLHPLIWRAILACAALLVLGILGFVGGGQDDNGLVIAVACLFVLATVTLGLVMGHILKRRRALSETRPESLRDWLRGEVDVWQGHLKGRDAAAAVLLPIGAVAIGMVIFALVLHFDVSAALTG